MKRILFTIITLFFVQGIWAQSISLTGQWNYTIPTTDITEAGEDFTGSYESSINQAYINIEDNNKWEISIRSNNIDWHSDLTLRVRRTGDGFGIGQIKGGTKYKTIKNGATKFFTGKNDRFSIPLQYKLDNVSVTIPAHTYIVEIIYTLAAN